MHVGNQDFVRRRDERMKTIIKSKIHIGFEDFIVFHLVNQ